MLKTVIKSLAGLIVVVILSAGAIMLFYGIPLMGLPNKEELVSVEIADAASGMTVTVTDAKGLERALGAAKTLSFWPGAAPEGQARYKLKFRLENGEEQSLSANETTGWHRGKRYKLYSENGQLFCNIIENFFFEPDGL